MNIKFNKRLSRIGIISFGISIAVTFFAYKTMEKKVQPEVTESIAYFKNDLDRDTVINDSNIEDHIKFEPTPISLIPEGAIKNKADIKNKRVVSNISKGEHVLSNKLIERGDIKINAEDLWIIGIDIDNISNFMGVQLQEGNSYELVHVDKDGLSTQTYEVKLANISDHMGRVITEIVDVAPKTINVAVKTYEEMLMIAQNKRNGNFDIVKPGTHSIEKVSEGE